MTAALVRQADRYAALRIASLNGATALQSDLIPVR